MNGSKKAWIFWESRRKYSDYSVISLCVYGNPGFHGNMRCVTCNKFEALVKETLAERFGDETAKGRLSLQVANVDKPENEHFIKDYGLTTQSVVLAKGGDFRNLDQIWTLVRQGDEAFKEYVAKNIREMLGEAK